MRIGWLGDWGGAYPMEPGILALCEAALRQIEEMGAVVEPLAPPFPAEKLWHAWITLRAMLNAGGQAARSTTTRRKRALLKPETHLGDRAGPGPDRATPCMRPA